MYLDETILQSKTTLELVDYIKRLYKLVTPHDLAQAKDIQKDYYEITARAEKAAKKRSF